MTEQERPKPLLSGVLYGEFAFWTTITGMTIAIIGTVIYFCGGDQFFDSQTLLDKLLAGENAGTIWQEAAGKEIVHGNWYLSNLSFGDAICMLGIGICGLAGILGIFGAVAGMVVKREKPYIFLILALLVALILILSATGLISIQ